MSTAARLSDGYQADTEYQNRREHLREHSRRENAVAQTVLNQQPPPPRNFFLPTETVTTFFWHPILPQKYANYEKVDMTVITLVSLIAFAIFTAIVLGLCVGAYFYF